jgi:hypothetical protein
MFALEFRTLAAGAGWNDRALIDHYHCSLREDVRRELACRDTTLMFDLEGVPAREPSVATDVTLPVGARLVPLGIKAAGKALWRHPR